MTYLTSRPDSAPPVAPAGRPWRRQSAAGRLGSSSGFSLIEMLLVVVMIVIIAAIGIPALYQQMARGRLTGACEQMASLFYNARLEAMKKGFPVVVQPDLDNRRMLAFLDDLAQNLTQDAGEPTLFDVAVPSDISQTTVYFMGPDLVMGTSADPAQSVDGLTPAGGLSKVVVFEPNGSIRDLGAIRLADGKTPEANVFEVRISPAATARIEIRKWIYGGADGLGADVWIPSGGGAWKWY